MPTASEPSVPAGAAFQTYAMAELDRAIECLGWRGARVHEGVHLARKSLRRVRATLALGGAGLGPGSALLDRELRGVIRGLSSARDAQALVETLDRLIDKRASDDEDRLLRRARRVAASARVGAVRTALAHDHGFGNRRALLEFMQAMLAALPWACVSLEQAKASIARSSQAVVKAARRARDSGHDDDWHRWRRRARRFSQQERVLASVGEQAASQRAGKALALLLGEAQDYSLLREHCGADSMFPDKDRLALCKLANKGSRRLRRKIAEASSEGA